MWRMMFVLIFVLVIMTQHGSIATTWLQRTENTSLGREDIKGNGSFSTNTESSSLKPVLDDVPPCSTLRKKFRGMSNSRMKAELAEYSLAKHEMCTIIYACKLQKSQDGMCPVLIDEIGTCFTSTAIGKIASTSCPTSLSDIPYDSTKNVTRLCRENGTWSDKSNYTNCRPILDYALLMCVGLNEYFRTTRLEGTPGEVLSPCKFHLHKLTVIAYVGRGISLFALIVAFILFWILRSIRCWRNIIHWNLVTSFILRNSFWILLHLFIDHQSRHKNTISCRVLVALFNYTQATNYFWMFVEGLYLHMMIVLAYTHQRIKLEVYLVIGWGIPVPLVLLWSVLKIQLEDHTCWMPDAKESKMVDYFMQIPIILILLVNAGILGNIVRILLTKLRAGYISGSANNETTEYRKAVKAALFLFPLLGVTYVVFFVSPSSKSPGQIIFLYFNACLQSIQGCVVCIIYCFANDEIQKALAKKLNLWRWQSGCPCQPRRDDIANPHSRISSISLSRTNRTLLATRDPATTQPNRTNKATESAMFPISCAGPLQRAVHI